MARQDSLICGKERMKYRGPIKVDGSASRCLPELVAEMHIPYQVDYPGDEFYRRTYEISGLTMVHRGSRSAKPEGHYWNPGSHCFQHHQPERVRS